MQAVHLLLRTQLLVCRRHPEDMGKYKYPVYRLLLDCLVVPPSCKDVGEATINSSPLLHEKRAEFVKTAVSLVFETCAVSPLNAEELVQEGGVATMNALLQFYLGALPALVEETTVQAKVASTPTVVHIVTQLARTISGVSFFESGRSAILALSDPSMFCVNWRKCIQGSFAGVETRSDDTVALTKYCLEGVSHMAKDSKLQELLIGGGIVLPLVGFLLGYDPTLEQVAATSDEQDDLQLSQAACNMHARLSARALGMLCGALKDANLEAPSNEALFRALEKLLTPQLARMLRNKRTGDLLRTLNTNIETPVRIWNVRMRDELMRFLRDAQSKRPADLTRPVGEELDQVAGHFGYASLKDEVVIGGVYIRVFNGLSGDRAAIHEIPDVTVFSKNVLNFIAQSLNSGNREEEAWEPLSLYEGDGLDSEGQSDGCDLNSRKFEMALVALRALVHVDSLVDDVLCERGSHAPSILLSLLELPQESQVRSCVVPLTVHSSDSLRSRRVSLSVVRSLHSSVRSVPLLMPLQSSDRSLDCCVCWRNLTIQMTTTTRRKRQ